MKAAYLLATAAAAWLVAGCGSQASRPSASAPPLPAESVQTASHPSSPNGKELSEYCRVCYVVSGHVMPPKKNAKYVKEKDGREYHFCSDWCRDEFHGHPEKYVLKG